MFGGPIDMTPYGSLGVIDGLLLLWAERDSCFKVIASATSRHRFTSHLPDVRSRPGAQ